MSAEESKQEHRCTERKGNGTREKQRFCCTLIVAASCVLSNESGERGKKRHRHYREENEQFFGNSDASRLDKSQFVDYCRDNQKGYADQKVLQGNGCSDRKNAFYCTFAENPSFVTGKGNFFFLRYMSEKRTLDACAIIVASAAPAASI